MSPRLPSSLRPLYHRGLGLLALPFRDDWTITSGMEEEMRGFCETVVRPEAAQAISASTAPTS